MSRRQRILELKSNGPHVLPSLLLCDFGDLKSECQRLEQAGIECLHLDVMDGQFVPNLTYGMPIVEGLRRHTKLPLDVHLMIADPAKYIDQFFEAGADAITFHIEACPDPQPVLKRIRELGAASGIVVNPKTPLEKIESCVGLCDIVLIMSVEAGFGGQSFQSSTLERLVQAREMFGPDVLLEVDGGVNKTTIGDCVQNGAELLVAGSAIFRQRDYQVAVSELNDLAAGSTQSS
ncbi:MAG: ribulose-phosphate 3-epimerase [Planctomycetota bacterium]